jgi:N-acyl-D-aspartate/D-glutamate deacylase
MRHELCTVGSDATALGVDGPLAGQSFMGAYTWAGWTWRRAVTETKVFTMEEAVKRLTSAPADRIGLRGRGRLAAGAAADIIVFDAAKFRETGTLESPDRLAAGMKHVVVNGVVTLEDGRLTGKRGGKALRRGRD